MADDVQPKRPRGFQCLTPERRREIAGQGGRTAHALGRAHQFDSDEGKAAGRKGGLVSGAKKRQRAEQERATEG